MCNLIVFLKKMKMSACNGPLSPVFLYVWLLYIYVNLCYLLLIALYLAVFDL